MMLDRLPPDLPSPAGGTASSFVATASWTTGRVKMAGDKHEEDDRARRFRDAALPHLDDVFTYARYLMRNVADAEDAVQECYLRALRHFDTFRGSAMKPWLLAILKNVCNAEFARRSNKETPADCHKDDPVTDQTPMWQEPQASPEAALLRRHDDATIRRLIGALPQPFREAIVLREINNLSYGEIAQIAGVPVGTVMSRLARARALLRSAWNLAEGSTP
jgi:RNA polymerase sigma factor (sigma-70 family)